MRAARDGTAHRLTSARGGDTLRWNPRPMPMTDTPTPQEAAPATPLPTQDPASPPPPSLQWGDARATSSSPVAHWHAWLGGAGLFVAGALVASAAWLWVPGLSARVGGEDPVRASTSTPGAAAGAAAPSPALDALLQSRDTFERDARAQALAARSTPAELEALLRALGGRTGPAAEALRATLLTRLAGLDPARALGAIADLQPDLAGRTPELVAHVFDAWGRRDLQAAIGDWRLLDGVDRELAAEALLAVVLERGGDAEAFLRALSPPVPVARLRTAIARDAALRDPEGAWLQAFRQRDVEGLRTIVRTWARADARAALAAIERASSSTLRTELRSLALTTWLRREPDAALEAVFNGAPPDAQVLASVAYTLGSSMGPAGFDTVFERIPPEQQGAAFEPFLQGALAQDPEGAWQLTRRLPLADDVRARVRGTILQQVAATGPGQAITLANSLSDTTERDALMQMLSEDYREHDERVALQFIMEIDDLTLRAALRNALAARATPTGESGTAGATP